MPDALVKVEDAPIGVQIWPTLAPEFASNFTLERVEIVRDIYRTFVRWVYESGTVRTFALGTEIVVRLPAPDVSDRPAVIADTVSASAAAIARVEGVMRLR